MTCLKSHIIIFYSNQCIYITKKPFLNDTNKFRIKIKIQSNEKTFHLSRCSLYSLDKSNIYREHLVRISTAARPIIFPKGDSMRNVSEANLSRLLLRACLMCLLRAR
mgnify:CR=1 FL=1